MKPITLIQERLAKLGFEKIPDSARELINKNIETDMMAFDAGEAARRERKLVQLVEKINGRAVLRAIETACLPKKKETSPTSETPTPPAVKNIAKGSAVVASAERADGNATKGVAEEKPSGDEA